MMNRDHRQSGPAMSSVAAGIAALLAGTMLMGTPLQASERLIPLYAWWNPSNTDNMVTTDARWSGKPGDKKSGYSMVRIAGYLYSPDGKQPAGTIPLHRWWNPTRDDNFTTSRREWAGAPGRVKDGYQYVRLEGYLAKAAGASRVPLMSFWSPSRTDNWATTKPELTGKSTLSPDYRGFGREGYLEKTAGAAR